MIMYRNKILYQSPFDFIKMNRLNFSSNDDCYFSKRDYCVR